MNRVYPKMMQTTILSNADVANILRAATCRKDDDTKYADHLLKTLVHSAQNANLKMRFWDAIYAKRPAHFLLYQLHEKQQYGTATHSVEDVINEYDVLENLAAACGQYVVATYYNDGQNINIYLEFKPPVKSDVHVVTIPVADTLEERRHEKSTSW
jgi:hypothetical protein